MEDGSSGYFYKMLSYLNKYIKNGIIKGGSHARRRIVTATLRCGMPTHATMSICTPTTTERYSGCRTPSRMRTGAGRGTIATPSPSCTAAIWKRRLRMPRRERARSRTIRWCYLQLGKLRAHFGDRDGALDAVRQGLSLVPGDREFLTLEREIEEGATIEQMCFHWVDGAYDEELQQASRAAELPQEGAEADAIDDMYQKQRSSSASASTRRGSPAFCASSPPYRRAATRATRPTVISRARPEIQRWRSYSA